MKQDTYIPMLFANIYTKLQGIESAIPSGVKDPGTFIEAYTNSMREDLERIKEYCAFMERRVQQLTEAANDQ